MKASCPACGARFDLECAIADADGRRVAGILAELPAAIGPLMLQYLGLFRPAGGGLRYSRMLTLLEELRPLIAEERVVRNGRTWSAPQGLWLEALQHLAARPGSLHLPLKSNGYLLEIVAAMAERFAAKAEQAHHERMQRGERDDPSPRTRTDPTRVSDIIAGIKENIR